MKYLDDIFDKRFSDELSHKLRLCNWEATNVANRFSWPYGVKGTHILLGISFFECLDEYKYHYYDDKQFSFRLIDAFKQITKRFDRKLTLTEISANLQFKGMDGTLHTDGGDDEFAYIYMLSDDIIFQDYGGEFYNKTHENAVPFLHGRVIEIKASDLHCGMAFNKDNMCRFSIKFVGKC